MIISTNTNYAKTAHVILSIFYLYKMNFFCINLYISITQFRFQHHRHAKILSILEHYLKIIVSKVNN